MGVLYQYARPVADVAVGAWRDEGGSAVSLYQSIDEPEPIDTGDWIQVESAPQAGDPSLPYTGRFGVMTDPGTDAEHRIEWWDDMAGGGTGSRQYTWRVETSSGLVIATGTQAISPLVGPPEARSITLTVGQAAALEGHYGGIRFGFTLLGDSTLWVLKIVQAQFVLPVTFSHLETVGGGWRVSSPGSGTHVLDGGAGARVGAGVERSESLLESGPGLRRRGG